MIGWVDEVVKFQGLQGLLVGWMLVDLEWCRWCWSFPVAARARRVAHHIGMWMRARDVDVGVVFALHRCACLLLDAGPFSGSWKWG